MRADVIPQLADADEVLEAIDPPEGVALSVLIPNEKGLENALKHRERFQEVNLFLSASEIAQPQEREPVDRGVAVRARARDRASTGGRGCAARA